MLLIKFLNPCLTTITLFYVVISYVILTTAFVILLSSYKIVVNAHCVVVCKSAECTKSKNSPLAFRVCTHFQIFYPLSSNLINHRMIWVVACCLLGAWLVKWRLSVRKVVG